MIEHLHGTHDTSKWPYGSRPEEVLDRAPARFHTAYGRCHGQSIEDRCDRCRAPAVRGRPGDGRPPRAPRPEPVRWACAEGDGADCAADQPLGRHRPSMPDAGVAAGRRGRSRRGDQRQGRGGRRPGRDTTRHGRRLGSRRRPGHERPRNEERVLRFGQPAAPTSIRNSPPPTRAETASPALWLRIGSPSQRKGSCVLLDSDPSIRWQVERDLTREPEEVVAAERTRFAVAGPRALEIRSAGAALRNPRRRRSSGSGYRGRPPASAAPRA
jgi:hypothetical protein